MGKELVFKYISGDVVEEYLAQGWECVPYKFYNVDKLSYIACREEKQNGS